MAEARLDIKGWRVAPAPPGVALPHAAIAPVRSKAARIERRITSGAALWHAAAEQSAHRTSFRDAIHSLFACRPPSDCAMLPMRRTLDRAKRKVWLGGRPCHWRRCRPETAMVTVMVTAMVTAIVTIIATITVTLVRRRVRPSELRRD